METKLYTFYDGVLVIKDGVDIIPEGPFENMDIKTLILPNSIKEIKPYAFYNNNIENIYFNNNLEIIGNQAFKNNNIKLINLPDNINYLGKDSFYGNKIININIPSKINTIESNCFANNNIEKLNIPENVKEIKNGAFSNNNIKELSIENGLKFIGENSFSHNKITNLTIPDSVDTIGKKAFYQDGIENIILSNNLKKIDDEVFKFNKIENLELNNNLEYIGKNAFDENIIKSIIFNDNLKEIDNQAFYNNKLKYLNIPKNIKKIGDESFFNNPLDLVYQSNNLEHIGKNVYSTNILKIDNQLYPFNLLDKYKTNNINKVLKIKSSFKNFNFDIIDYYDLCNLPITKENINGYKVNFKKYNDLYDYAKGKYKFSKINKKDSKEYHAFFNLCYILGIFSTGGNELKENIQIIKEIISTHTEQQLIKMFYDVKELKYYKKFKNIIMEYTNNDDIDYFLKYINKLYNNFDNIQKSIQNQKKYDLYILNNKYKNTNDKKILNEINYVKKNIKNLTYMDIKKYFNNSIFNIKNTNKELNEIALVLSRYVITQNDFNKIQNIYEQYDEKKENKYFQNVNDSVEGKIKYEWLNGNNPKNFILGYIVSCCAKINGRGEDIMTQSVLNPNIKNIVIYDSAKNIIGKSTAFYNEENKYILCNNIQLSQKFIYSNKTSQQDRIDAYKAIKRALMDQKNKMEIDNIPVDEIRMGMGDNNLSDIIQLEDTLILKDNLLENYKFKGHNGDANSKMYGQAVIYRKKI